MTATDGLDGLNADDGVESTLPEGLPEPDPVDVERARARVERAMFGEAEPARVGRYEIRDPIAGGGMGIVYLAYDPELQRKVALKVLHPRRNLDRRARHRMLVEARALAKLDHPNVVKVHDVIVVERQIVIVMELVAGETLVSWIGRAPRAWQAIVAAYTQAGEGLAAAHGVGVVHRDFKPANAIIGDDARVRVLDFGLARLAAAAEPRQRSGAAPTGFDELTASGDVLGTVAYSAPEQLDGAPVTAASDQFSLCVALWHAVEGVAPFDGETPAARSASIRAGQLKRGRDRRGVPRWLGAVLERGLAADPARRYPTLRELLTELNRQRGWRRWRLPVLGAVVAIGSAAAAWLLGPSVVPPACDGGVAQLAEVWSAGARARVAAAIGAFELPDAADVERRVVAQLDGYGTAWRDTHRAACVAHRDGASSAGLFDRQLTCLARRLVDLRAAVEVLGRPAGGSLDAAIDVAARMPAVSGCADAEWLLAEPALPAPGERRRQVAAVRARLSRVAALDHAGRAEPALAEAVEAVAGARAAGYPPVQVEAALAEGRLRIARRDLEGARAALGPARGLALEHQMLAAAVEASARLIYVEGMAVGDLERLERDLAYVLPLSAGLGGDGFARALLLNNAGTVYLAASKRAEAAALFEQAHELITRRAIRDLELAGVEGNLAMVTADDARRMALARHGWERVRAALGDHHLQTLEALMRYAQDVLDPEDAFARMTTVADGYQRFHPGIVRPRVHVAVKRAFLAGELADRDRARAVALYEAAVEATAPASAGGDADLARWHHLVAGELALLHDDAGRAVAELVVVHRASIASRNWWERADALRAAVGLGRAELALRHTDAAARYLEQAVQGYPEIRAINEDVEHRRSFARAQRGLADLLRSTGQDPARVTRLQDSVDAWHRLARP
jgi:eukaryotic-like serine/threonine-protein kinase